MWGAPGVAGGLVRRVARAALPEIVRRRLRRALVEAPIRARDLGPDLRDALGLSTGRLPPARLRRAVGRTSARREWLEVGKVAARDLLAATAEAGAESLRSWLDFGCGCGRVAFHLAVRDGLELWGVDVDRRAVAWARKHIRGGRFEAIDPLPPSGLPGGRFEVASAVSVFTHFDREMERRWLAELRRLLAPGGLLLASTHNESLVYARPDLVPAQLDELAERGFVFASGSGPFNEGSAFHSEAYLLATWGELFEPVAYHRHGLAGYQDLSVWRRA